MVKITPKISSIAENKLIKRTLKTREIQISTKSGLPYEMPLDNFQKETELINILHPATPMYNAKKEIQNALDIKI